MRSHRHFPLEDDIERFVRHAIRRRMFRPHPGMFGAGPFGPRGGGEGGHETFRARRMMRDGDLRLVALALIAEAPRHGYDIIKALEERSRGAYSPSPGVIYPTLTFLEEAGYAASTTEANRKVYAITEAGRAHLAANQEQVEAALDEIERFGRRMEGAREWFGWFEDERAESPDRSEPGEDVRTAFREFRAARRDLRAALAALVAAGPAHAAAAAEILRTAAEDLRRAAEGLGKKE